MQARAVSRANARNRGNMQIYDARVVERFLEELEESPGSATDVVLGFALWTIVLIFYVTFIARCYENGILTKPRENSEEFRLVRILY